MDLVQLIEYTKNLLNALPDTLEYIILDVSFKVQDNFDEEGKEVLSHTIIFNTDVTQELNSMKIKLFNKKKISKK
jgi:hypothetical protein